MNDILQQAEQYHGHALYLGYGHYKAGKRAARRHLALGVPVVVLTSAVGTSIFATLSTDPGVPQRIIAGLVSLLATTLAVLQTFFRFSELAQKHKSAGARYGALRREIDVFRLSYSDMKEDARQPALEELQAIGERLGQLAEESPDLSDELYDEAKRVYSDKA